MSEVNESRPESVDPIDIVRLESFGLKQEILRLREENARLSAQLLAVEDKQYQASLKAKYKLEDKDRIDPQSLRVIRAE